MSSPWAVIGSDKLYDALMNTEAPEHVIEFFHGYRPPGHPVVRAALSPRCNCSKKTCLFARGRWAARRATLSQHLQGPPNVIGIRSMGCAAAVELAPIPSVPGKRAYDIFVGVFPLWFVCAARATLVIAPPYIVEKQHIDQLVNTLADAIRVIA